MSKEKGRLAGALPDRSPSVEHSRGGTAVSELRSVLAEFRERRERLVELRKEADQVGSEQFGDIEQAIAKIDRSIRAVERDIRKAVLRTVRENAPELWLEGLRLDRQIAACRIHIASRSQRPRSRPRTPRRRNVGRARARSPGRPDEPDDPVAAGGAI